jgi:hypothetical protein
MTHNLDAPLHCRRRIARLWHDYHSALICMSLLTDENRHLLGDLHRLFPDASLQSLNSLDPGPR